MIILEEIHTELLPCVSCSDEKIQINYVKSVSCNYCCKQKNLKSFKVLRKVASAFRNNAWQ